MTVKMIVSAHNLALLLALATATAEDTIHEYCETDTFQPQCSGDEVIMMTSAFYGRMALGRCISQNYGHIGCKADVLDILDSYCSGRKSCLVKGINEFLLSAKSTVCPKDFAAYLSPQHKCVKVLQDQGNSCQQNSFINKQSKSGYIVPSINKLQGSSSSGCEWRLLSAEGRKVNVSLYNFPPMKTSGNAQPSSACYEIGSITENGIHKTIHKCLSDARHKILHISKGGKLTIKFNNAYDSEVAGTFMVYYHSAGCTNPTIPVDTRLERNGDEATVICEKTSQKWHLTCRGDNWEGDLGECTEETDGWSFLGMFDHTHPFGTAIVVGIGATLGVLIGGLLLYIIIAIFKRCQKSDYVMTYEYTDPSFAHIPTDYHADKSNLLLQDDKLFEQNSNTWGSQHHGNSNTLSRGGTDHSRVPLPPLPNDNNTLSYEKPLYNRNGNV